MGLTERETSTKRKFALRKKAAKKIRKGPVNNNPRDRVQQTSAAIKDTPPGQSSKYYSGAYERY